MKCTHLSRSKEWQANIIHLLTCSSTPSWKKRTRFRLYIASNLTWNKQINHKWEIFTWNWQTAWIHSKKHKIHWEYCSEEHPIFCFGSCPPGIREKNLGPTINRTDNPTGTNKDEWDQIYSQLAIFLWYGLQHARGCITYSFILICYWHEYFNRGLR